MITVKRLRVTYEEISNEHFREWLKDIYESVGDDLDGMEAIQFYLDEDWEGTNYTSGWECNTEVEVLGLTDEQALAMIKEVAEECKSEEEDD